MLAGLDPTLTRLDGLVTTIRPGARQLNALATPLSAAIGTLGHVAPQLNTTLATVQQHAGVLTSLLADAKPTLTRLRPALDQITPIAACLAPYAPELGGFIETWQSFTSYYDANMHYARAEPQLFPFPNETPLTPSAIAKTIPNVGYALIRPPGYSAGHTRYDDQCGAGTSGLNAALDPERGGG
jgi:ABC-type transporter Mla subunit MlaD